MYKYKQMRRERTQSTQQVHIWQLCNYTDSEYCNLVHICDVCETVSYIFARSVRRGDSFTSQWDVSPVCVCVCVCVFVSAPSVRDKFSRLIQIASILQVALACWIPTNMPVVLHYLDPPGNACDHARPLRRVHTARGGTFGVHVCGFGVPVGQA
jgi:hypothetical protein